MFGEKPVFFFRKTTKLKQAQGNTFLGQKFFYKKK
jgi:hypothetical protein